jgi:hypothetical protein
MILLWSLVGLTCLFAALIGAQAVRLERDRAADVARVETQSAVFQTENEKLLRELAASKAMVAQDTQEIDALKKVLGEAQAWIEANKPVNKQQR